MSARLLRLAGSCTLLTLAVSCAGAEPLALSPDRPLAAHPALGWSEAGPVSAQDVERARLALGGHVAALELAGLHELVPVRAAVDELGMAHVRVQQTLDGVPVFGGEAIVHLHPDGQLRSITDDLVPAPRVDTTPLYSQDEAVELAVAGWGRWEHLTEDPDASLWVLRQDDGDHLAWRVQLRRLDGSAQTSMPVLFIDAHTGQELWRYENLHTGVGTGKTNYYGTVSVKVYKPKGDTLYYLEDPGRDIGTYSFGGTYSSAYYVTDSDTAFTTAGQEEAVEAHYAASEVWDYYLYTHNWMGLDDVGGPGYIESLDGTGDTVISLFVNYGSAYANAFWDGSAMYFGDGDGSSIGPLTTIDIAGHEMTHGVTGYTAGFTYYGESGALDEGYADIFGAMVERYALGESADTWMIGEECYTPSTAGDAVRYLDDPAADGFTTSHYNDLYTGSYDSGGVHINAGIINLAFYLLSEGGNHPDYGGTAMTGIGADKAAKIAWRALDRYLTSSSDFEEARHAWLDAAQDLYGGTSAEYEATMDAWALVGVGVSSSTSTCSGYEYTFAGLLPTLSGLDYKFYPNSKGYSSTTSGTHSVKMTGDSGTDFDVFLQKYNSSTAKWDTAARSKTSGTSTESLSVTGKGKYRVYVKRTSGSGDFTACLTNP